MAGGVWTGVGARRWAQNGVTLCDQVLSGVSNVLAVVLIARVLSAEEFGRFAMGYAILIVALGLSRGYFGTRVSLTADQATARRVTSHVLVALLLLSPVIAAVVFGVSAAVTGGESPGILLIVACATPIVCMQDILRFGAVATGRPMASLVSDAVWVAAMALPLLLHATLSSAAVLYLWSSAAFLALVVAFVLTDLDRLDVHGAFAELRRRDGTAESLTFGGIVTMLAGLVVLLVVSAGLGPTAAGSLRGAATAMGPVNVLLAFVGLGLTPTLVRRQRSQDVRFCAVTGLLLIGATAVWGTILLLLPQWAGGAAFGESWPGIRQVLPWTVGEYVFLCAAGAAMLGLRVRRRARHIIRIRILFAVVMVVSGSAAAILLADVRAVAAALAASTFVFAVTSCLQFVREPPSAPQEKRQVGQAEAGAGVP